ncbi:MAG TPA: hypothetical protein VIM16_12450 [Mucilaginibacter sp.]
MNKFIKPIFCILFILAFGYKSFGQTRVRLPIERYGTPTRVPVQRVPVQRSYPVNRQPNSGGKIEVVKENYIGLRLKLTRDEAKAFWPLYRQYVQEQTAVRIAERINNSKDSPDGTRQIDNELKYETELVNIRKHFRDEFLKILPPEKVSELYKSEREFKDEMLRQLSERSVRAGD